MTEITPYCPQQKIKHWIDHASETDLLSALDGEHGALWIQWSTDFTRETLAHYAAKRHYCDVLRKMSHMGFDMKREDESGDHALHYALIYSGDGGDEKDTIEFLLQCGLARNDCNEAQLVPVAQLMVERKWKGQQQDPVEWLILAMQHGMSITEEVSDNLTGTPLEIMAKYALDPAREEIPYEQCLIGLLDRGAISEGDVRLAMIWAMDSLITQNPLTQPLLNPIHHLRSWLDRVDIEKATANASRVGRARL